MHPFTYGQERSGFTLIELSIVLVVIGLIVGGVLAGREMIAQATLRKAIGQFEKFDTAVNTFYNKYRCLPGDCAYAAQYGFVTRSGAYANGNGDSILQGCSGVGEVAWGYSCENLVFWRDLSEAGMIEGGFTSADFGSTYTATASTTPPISAYLPASPLGGTHNVKLVTCLVSITHCSYSEAYLIPGHHYGLWSTTATGFDGTYEAPTESYTMPIFTAYGIDSKIDDGLPLRGKVQTFLKDNLASLQMNTGCYENDASGNRIYAVDGSLAFQNRCGITVKSVF